MASLASMESLGQFVGFNRSFDQAMDQSIWPFLFCIRIESFEGARTGQNFPQNFKRPKNGEDGSDFDDFWTKRIAALTAKFRKKFGPSKKFPRGRKIRKSFAKSLKNFVLYTVFGTKQNRNVHIYGSYFFPRPQISLLEK